MSSGSVEKLTKAQVRKAGDQLRRWQRSGRIADSDQERERVRAAWATAVRFRDEHIPAMFEVADIVREVVGDCMNTEVVVGTRPKRIDRIIEKITRAEGGLHRLQDIGGCRVVLPTLFSVEESAAALVKRFPGCRVHNRIAAPRLTGYRAIHIVVSRKGYLIKVQLRTQRQNEWALAVESAEDLTGYALKDGDAPPPVLDFFAVAAEIIALEERGEEVDTGYIARLEELREQVRPYFRRTGT